MKQPILELFQNECFKTFRSLGFSADNANTIFDIIIEMRNIYVSAKKKDTILLHKHMGLCIGAISNYATVNDINLAQVITERTYSEIEEATGYIDLEFYLEKIKDDLSFVKDMDDVHKIEFIQKCWVCTFPEEYHNDFLKIERILKNTIQDNKIKYKS